MHPFISPNRHRNLQHPRQHLATQRRRRWSMGVPAQCSQPFRADGSHDRGTINYIRNHLALVTAPWVFVRIFTSVGTGSVLSVSYSCCPDDDLVRLWRGDCPRHILRRWERLSPISSLSRLSFFHRAWIFFSFIFGGDDLASFLCSCLRGVARAFTVMFCGANY